MRTKVNIILRDPLNEHETHTLGIIPIDAPIGRKWIDELKICLDSQLKVEKNFCWVGWPDSPRNLDHLTSELRKYVKTINDYNDDPGCLWKEPYIITEEFYANNVITNEIDVNHDLFNRLHHHFEVLQGQAWNISHWFINANNETRYAIRQLNNLCHEMESLIKQVRSKRFGPQYVNPSAIIAFLNSPRKDLVLEDHDYFTLQRGGGRVFLGYNQIGKTHWEAFIDGDEHIHDSGISGLIYVSGEITIDFGTETLNIPAHQARIADYARWLEEHGLSIDNKSLAHGWLHVASIDYSPYEEMGMDQQQMHKYLSKFLDIYKVQIVEDDIVVAESTYDYHWNKSDYEAQLKAELFPTYKTFCNNTD
jgi:hypothetical protein